MVKVGKYDYQKSTKPDKKLMVKVKGKTIHFGDKRYQHFFDKTGLLPKKLNHKDEDRRKSYRARVSGIKNKKGELTYLNPESANYHSYNVLW